MQRRHDPHKKDLRASGLPPGPAKLVSQPRVSIRKTFAQFFFLCTLVLNEKKQQFAQSFAKVISRKIALFRFCETQVLRNSAIS